MSDAALHDLLLEALVLSLKTGRCLPPAFWALVDARAAELLWETLTARRGREPAGIVSGPS